MPQKAWKTIRFSYQRSFKQHKGGKSPESELHKDSTLSSEVSLLLWTFFWSCWTTGSPWRMTGELGHELSHHRISQSGEWTVRVSLSDRGWWLTQVSNCDCHFALHWFLSRQHKKLLRCLWAEEGYRGKQLWIYQKRVTARALVIVREACQLHLRVEE